MTDNDLECCSTCGGQKYIGESEAHGLEACAYCEEVECLGNLCTIESCDECGSIMQEGLDRYITSLDVNKLMRRRAIGDHYSTGWGK